MVVIVLDGCHCSRWVSLFSMDVIVFVVVIVLDGCHCSRWVSLFLWLSLFSMGVIVLDVCHCSCSCRYCTVSIDYISSFSVNV